MTLRQLEILRALILHRTTVAAAQQLALSQPAISNALRAMEAQAGFALFERVNNRLHPTPEALALFRESEEIFALHARLETRLNNLREGRSGQLRIVATPPLAYGIIPPALKRLLRGRPGLHVWFDVRRFEGVVEAVRGHMAELGFALGFSEQPGIGCEVVASGEMVCVVPPAHPLARRNAVAAADLADFPLIGMERGTRLGEAVRRSFQQADVPFRPSVEVRYCNTACVLAAAGVGVGVVDPFSPRQSGEALVVRPFLPATPALAYVLWSEAQPLSRAARMFLDEIRSASRTADPRIACP